MWVEISLEKYKSIPNLNSMQLTDFLFRRTRTFSARSSRTHLVAKKATLGFWCSWTTGQPVMHFNRTTTFSTRSKSKKCYINTSRASGALNNQEQHRPSTAASVLPSNEHLPKSSMKQQKPQNSSQVSTGKGQGSWLHHQKGSRKPLLGKKNMKAHHVLVKKHLKNFQRVQEDKQSF